MWTGAQHGTNTRTTRHEHTLTPAAAEPWSHLLLVTRQLLFAALAAAPPAAGSQAPSTVQSSGAKAVIHAVQARHSSRGGHREPVACHARLLLLAHPPAPPGTRLPHPHFAEGSRVWSFHVKGASHMCFHAAAVHQRPRDTVGKHLGMILKFQ